MMKKSIPLKTVYLPLDLCTCGAGSRAHKKDCLMSSRNHYTGCILFPKDTSSDYITPRSDKACVPSSNAGSSELGKRERSSRDQAPPTKKPRSSMSSLEVRDCVCVCVCVCVFTVTG